MTIGRRHDGTILFEGRLDANELNNLYLTLNVFDRALLTDAGGPTSDGPHDWLLVLEMLFRRLHEQQQEATATKAIA